jgi:hypothetical protein
VVGPLKEILGELMGELPKEDPRELDWPVFRLAL